MIESLLKNKLVQFIIVFWLVVIGLAKLGEYVSENGHYYLLLLKIVVGFLAFVLACGVALTLYKRGRSW